MMEAKNGSGGKGKIVGVNHGPWTAAGGLQPSLLIFSIILRNLDLTILKIRLPFTFRLMVILSLNEM